MKRTQYLYGKEPTELSPMEDGLLDRIRSGEELLLMLLEEPLQTRDWNRIRDVVNAIEHNNKLLHGVI